MIWMGFKQQSDSHYLTGVGLEEKPIPKTKKFTIIDGKGHLSWTSEAEEA